MSKKDRVPTAPPSSANTLCTYDFTDASSSTNDWVLDIINVREVYCELGFFGSGISVRINDSGVYNAHKEFEGKFSIENSCEAYTSPHPDDHGTKVASLVGAIADNDICAQGIAPEVSEISSCNVYGSQRSQEYYDGNFFSHKYNTFDISVNSWGPATCRTRPATVVNPNGRSLEHKGKKCPFTKYADSFLFQGESVTLTNPCDVCDFEKSLAPEEDEECFDAIRNYCFYQAVDEDLEICLGFSDITVDNGVCEFEYPNESWFQSLETAASLGRNEKGAIFIFAAGNGFRKWVNTNFLPLLTSRYAIVVGAIESDDKPYSTPGANMFVTVPGADATRSLSAATTEGDTSCKLTKEGTSFTAPIVAGVVALMLEANTDLTWRDVQEILVLTSRTVSDEYDESLVKNAAGLWHSDLYGFGIIDAYNAVLHAKNWIPIGVEMKSSKESKNLKDKIPDKENKKVKDKLKIEDDFLVENVIINIKIKHVSRGDLKIELESPQGTKSVLWPGNRPERSQLDESDTIQLRTVRNWGEKSKGDWKLTISDLRKDTENDCVNLPWYLEDYFDGILEMVDCVDMEQESNFKKMAPFALPTYEGGGLEKCHDCCPDPNSNGCDNDLSVKGWDWKDTNYVYEERIERNITCQDITDEKICKESKRGRFLRGKMIATRVNGLSAIDACCVFGGGISEKDFKRNELLGWSLDVYGHNS